MDTEYPESATSRRGAEYAEEARTTSGSRQGGVARQGAVPAFSTVSFASLAPWRETLFLVRFPVLDLR